MHIEVRPSEVVEQHIDKDNPWPGLSAFTEEAAFFFHGRDNEAIELYRLIKREPLTVLFGLSGLGKTSLLRAGVFPRLRRENFLPVYVRLSYVPGALDLVAQIKEALLDAAAKAMPCGFGSRGSLSARGGINALKARGVLIPPFNSPCPTTGIR